MLPASSIPAAATVKRNSLPMYAGILRGGHMLAGVEVSVRISESHNMSATAARTALESGAQAADHVIQNPDELTVTFAMTNAGNGAANACDVMDSFRKMKEEASLLELSTEHSLYRDMVITALNFDHNAPHKGALSGTMSLQRVHKVELQATGRDPENLADEAQKTMSAQVDAGKQETLDLADNAAAAAVDAAAILSAIRNGGAAQRAMQGLAGAVMNFARGKLP